MTRGGWTAPAAIRFQENWNEGRCCVARSRHRATRPEHVKDEPGGQCLGPPQPRPLGRFRLTPSVSPISPHVLQRSPGEKRGTPDRFASHLLDLAQERHAPGATDNRGRASACSSVVRVTLVKDWVVRGKWPAQGAQHDSPVVLSPDKLVRFCQGGLSNRVLNVTAHPMTNYAAGLRLSKRCRDLRSVIISLTSCSVLPNSIPTHPSWHESSQLLTGMTCSPAVIVVASAYIVSCAHDPATGRGPLPLGRNFAVVDDDRPRLTMPAGVTMMHYTARGILETEQLDPHRYEDRSTDRASLMSSQVCRHRCRPHAPTGHGL